MIDIGSEELDDTSWKTEDIVGLYKRAAKFAGYTDDDIIHFRCTANRKQMLFELNGLRTHGWYDVSTLNVSTVENTSKKIQFYSLEELELKLVALGF